MSNNGFLYPFGWQSSVSNLGIGDATSIQGKPVLSYGQTDNDLLQFNAATNVWEYKSVGEVLGVVGGNDNEVIRYDAATGFVQPSDVVIDDTGSITGANAITANTITANSDIFGGDIKSRASNNINIIDTVGTNLIALKHVGATVLQTSATAINTYEPIIQNDTTGSTGLGTGSLSVAGGASISGDVYVGDEIFGTTFRSIGSNNLNIIDTAGTNMINLQHGGLSALTTNSTVISTFKPIVQNDATPSSGGATGSLIVAGGASILGDLYVGDELYCSSLKVDTNKFVVDSAGNDSTISTQAQNLLVNVPSAGSRYFDVQSAGTSKFRVSPTLTSTVNPVSITNATASTLPTNGSLINAGGFGCTGNINSAGVIKTTNTTISTSKTTGSLICAGGLGCNGTINTAGLSFDNNLSVLSTYSVTTTTANIWRYIPTLYNYGTTVPISFIKMGNVRTVHFRVPASAGAGGLVDLRIAIAGAGGNVFLGVADRPLTDTYGMIYLKHLGVNSIGIGRVSTDGYIYLNPTVAWGSDVTNEVFTSTLTWTVSV